MENSFQSFAELKRLYPDEWLLLAEPEMDNTTVLGGVLLFHSKDKKEVCYIGKDKTAPYHRITLAYTGELRPVRRVGIMKRL